MDPGGGLEEGVFADQVLSADYFGIVRQGAGAKATTLRTRISAERTSFREETNYFEATSPLPLDVLKIVSNSTAEPI